MNVPLLKPNYEQRYEARRQFAAYKQLEKSGRSTAADRVAMKVYRQVQLGRTLISLHAAMKHAGVDARGRPKVAIVRADARWCFFRWDSWIKHNPDGSGIAVSEFRGSVSQHDRSGTSRGWGYRDRGLSILVDRGLFPIRVDRDIRAQVPSIPPALRPRSDLKNYHILWEADWEDVPHDPFLLRRVSGDWFVVLAQWDLTEVERSILATASYRESY